MDAFGRVHFPGLGPRNQSHPVKGSSTQRFLGKKMDTEKPVDFWP